LLRLSGFTREDVIDVDPEYLDQPCNRSWESLANEIVATPDQQDQDRDQDIWLVRIEDDEDADEQATELPAPTGVELPVEIRKREDFVGKQVNQDLLDAIGMTKELRALERAFIEIEKYEVYAYRRMQVADVLRPLLSFEEELFELGEQRRVYAQALSLLQSQHKKLAKDPEQRASVEEEIETTRFEIELIDDAIIQILIDMIPVEKQAA